MTLDVAPSPTFECKAQLYEWLVAQTAHLVEGMSCKFTPQANLIIGLGNVAALCFYELNKLADPNAALQHLPVNWFGFYLLQAPGVLALGPFQGRAACTEIRVGRGVCGTAADAGRSVVVEDVLTFPGHIACDSTSRAEVVVPIKLENGSVVGVIDVDSTNPGHFDATDASGLERVAAVLAAHLEFPMAKALAVNPALAFANFSASGNPAPQAEVAAAVAAPQTGDGTTLPPAPPTRVTGIPFMRVDVVRPDTTVKQVAGWSFTTTKLDRIMSQEELSAFEESIGIRAFPEIVFPYNSLVVEWEGAPGPVLHFDLKSILTSAQQYYETPAFKEEAAKELVIPVSESWATSQYKRHDPKVDWAWRNDFFGLSEKARLTPLEPHHVRINWDLLRDTTLPIVFFDNFDFFEDDVHDHGMVRSSLKFRVMNTAFFILFRHFIRVDGHEMWFREVRFFHEFTVKRESTPHLVVVEVVKKISLSDFGDVHAWKELSEDALSQKATVLREREATVEFL